MERRSSGSATGTNHVNQGNSEVGGVSSDGSPSNILTPGGGVPAGILARAGDGQGPCGGCKEGRGEDREGTHCFFGGREEGNERKE